MKSASDILVDLIFSEQWLTGSYTYVGIFILDGSDLTTSRIDTDFEILYQSTRRHRLRKLPRGIARYLLIPVYCASSFEKLTWEDLYGYNHPRRWGIVMKAILFNSMDNKVEAEHAMQNNTIMYYLDLKRLCDKATAIAATRFGYQPSLTKHYTKDLLAKIQSKENGGH